MGRAMLLVLLLLALVWARMPAARAEENVDVALVLVDDVSGSIDDSEFQLQKQGYVEAFTDPKVIKAIHDGALGAIAVAYIEFAGNGQVKTVLNWTVIRDAASARSFATQLRAQPRSFRGFTAIGAGIRQAMQVLEGAPVAERRIIDVCGDGTNNSGPDVSLIRDEAVKAGAVVNGLAIINDHPVSWLHAHVQPPGGLPAYYRENVTGGEGSFVLEVHDFHSFGEAMTRKLINEIAQAAVPAPG